MGETKVIVMMTGFHDLTIRYSASRAAA